MVKNEAKWLWYSVTSVINYVDKVLLWDTGSTDNSRKIEIELKKQYPDKVILNYREQNSPEDFTNVRQEMLDNTKSDWFLMIDGDEIWWEDSIAKVTEVIKSNRSNNGIESIVVPTINLVGDIYHYQDKSSGMYKFGSLEGHYNLRAINRSIPGLHSQGIHGVWGWADGENKMIQDRKTYKFIDAPYLHATNIQRSQKDNEVIKRNKKIKYELGVDFPKDYFYPEAFFKNRSDFVESPWQVSSDGFKVRALIETPFRKLKRKLGFRRVGY